MISEKSSIKPRQSLVKKLMQVAFCITVISSSAILVYWPDLLFISYAVLFIGVVAFGSLTMIVPDLQWNIVVVLLFWSVLYFLGISHCQSQVEIYRYLIKPANFIPIMIAMIIHVFFQTSFFLLTRQSNRSD